MNKSDNKDPGLKIDNLVQSLVFGPEEDKEAVFSQIKDLAFQQGIFFSSTNDFYLARGRGETALDFTVAAINLRGLTYDLAQAIFMAAKQKKVGAFILEIARSEIDYTNQSPQEYSGVVLAAAVKQGFTGPLFLQGDHFQAKTDKNGQLKEGEIEALESLINKAVQAGFYNLDLDLSTLVDYSQKAIADQQKTNILLTAKLALYCRRNQPEGVTLSLGGEIGHIGGKNSTIEELRAFLVGFKNNFPQKIIGMSKISIQTGTTHGGIVLPDGKLAKINLDFACLKSLGQEARRWGLAGVVQHGASTLPEQYFSQFVQAQAAEVHLATQWQNLVFDHKLFPQELLQKMYLWLDNNLQQEKETGQNETQFHYQQRKKCWGQFKKEIWFIPEKIKSAFRETVREKAELIFHALNLENTQELVNKFVEAPKSPVSTFPDIKAEISPKPRLRGRRRIKNDA